MARVDLRFLAGMRRRALLAFVAVVAAGDGISAEAVTAPPSRTSVSDGVALRTACDGRDGWTDEAPPARIVANVYYVGTCGISAVLITSPQGHALIDGPPAAAVPSILANVRRLGFEPRDVRVLLSSHEHADHAGGLAALKAATGARLLARREARTVLETGRPDGDDPQAGEITGFPPVLVDSEVVDGERVRVGALTFVARATPGHTRGGTTWTWRACESPGPCVDVVYADSLSAVSADGYRFVDHPAWVAQLRSSIDAIAALPCDVLITPHPGASALFDRLAAQAPLRDRGGCARYANAARERLERRLRDEASP